jgi:hypothetical protein
MHHVITHIEEAVEKAFLDNDGAPNTTSQDIRKACKWYGPGDMGSVAKCCLQWGGGFYHPIAVKHGSRQGH